MPSSLCVQEIGVQGAEHPSWWSVAPLVGFRRNGDNGPLNLQDGRWDGGQPGQFTFVPCQMETVFCVPGHETAWKALL